MRIEELSLATAFRYASAGVVVWAYLAVLDWPTARAVVRWIFAVGGALGGTSLSAALALALGTLIYFLYRAFLYEPIFLHLQDLSRWWTDNYRTWLSSIFKLSLRDSQRLADILGELPEIRASEGMKRASAGIHVLYVTGISGIVECLVLRAEPRPFWTWIPCSRLLYPSLYGVLLFAAGCLLGGFLLDRRQESYELLQFRSAYSPGFVDRLVSRTGLNRVARENRRFSDWLRDSVREKWPRRGPIDDQES